MQDDCVCRTQLYNNDATSSLNSDFDGIIQKNIDSISISTNSIVCPQCGPNHHHRHTYRRVEYGTYYCKHCCSHDHRSQTQ